MYQNVILADLGSSSGSFLPSLATLLLTFCVFVILFENETGQTSYHVATNVETVINHGLKK